jgi:hypothetical protein
MGENVVAKFVFDGESGVVGGTPIPGIDFDDSFYSVPTAQIICAYFALNSVLTRVSLV